MCPSQNPSTQKQKLASHTCGNPMNASTLAQILATTQPAHPTIDRAMLFPLEMLELALVAGMTHHNDDDAAHHDGRCNAGNVDLEMPRQRR